MKFEEKWHPSLLADVEFYIGESKDLSIKGLAKYLSVSRQTVYNWCNMYPQFRLLVHNMRHQQLAQMPMWHQDKDGEVFKDL